MLENSLDIWIDVAYGIFGASHFIRSLCPSEFPEYASIKWYEPDKTRLKDDNDELPLLHGQVQEQSKNLNLYTIGEAAWVFFRKNMF
jgi:hypothetical protein